MGMTKANIECAFTRRQFNPCGKEIVGLPIDHLSAPCRSKRPDRAAMGNDVVLGWFSMPAPFARNQERDFMKNFLSAAALVATCCVALPGAANAISVLDAASLPRIQSGAVERIDWRPFRHCHGRPGIVIATAASFSAVITTGVANGIGAAAAMMIGVEAITEAIATTTSS
jgi:hypothetical protein